MINKKILYLNLIITTFNKIYSNDDLNQAPNYEEKTIINISINDCIKMIKKSIRERKNTRKFDNSTHNSQINLNMIDKQIEKIDISTNQISTYTSIISNYSTDATKILTQLISQEHLIFDPNMEQAIDILAIKSTKSVKENRKMMEKNHLNLTDIGEELRTQLMVIFKILNNNETTISIIQLKSIEKVLTKLETAINKRNTKLKERDKALATLDIETQKIESILKKSLA